ncbi:MAG: type IV pilus twitching motility protein PilT [Chloroflexi bacterium]|nr:type IV pilus twitching motility protein PilT [Chloroflexota bacterium]
MDVKELLSLIGEGGASDLHIKVGSPPILRRHGVLAPIPAAPPLTTRDAEAIFNEVTTQPQKEIFHRTKELDLAYEMPGVARFRVNCFWQRGTISIAFRLVPIKIPSLQSLSLPEVCKSLILKPRGLVVVTGPTGSGKSTTLAAMIDYLNQREARHIVTVEDPIEFLHQDKKCLIAQREVGVDTLSFAEALKHALREDPDVILLGEMRDLETVATAITAAETGHLVLATLHTPSATQAVDRLIDIFPPAQQLHVRLQLAMSLEGVLFQTLLPRIGGGLVPAVEIMVATPAVRNLIREGKTYQVANLLHTGAQFGMQTLDQALESLIKQRTITLEDGLAVSQTPEELRRLLSPR